MMEGVGRRLGSSGFLLDIGANSLNGREHNVLFRNNGDGSFTDVGWVNAADRIEDARSVATLDVDGNGSVDILLRNYAAPAVLLKNREGERQSASFELIGTSSNRDAIGARIRVRTGDHWQTRVVTSGSGYLSASSRRQHFGLGDATRIDEVTIDWPSGRHSVLRDLPAGQLHHLTEPARTDTASIGE